MGCFEENENEWMALNLLLMEINFWKWENGFWCNGNAITQLMIKWYFNFVRKYITLNYFLIQLAAAWMSSINSSSRYQHQQLQRQFSISDSDDDAKIATITKMATGKWALIMNANGKEKKTTSNKFSEKMCNYTSTWKVIIEWKMFVKCNVLSKETLKSITSCRLTAILSRAFISIEKLSMLQEHTLAEMV